MDRNTPSRVVAAAVATLGAVVGFVGCDETPKFDPALQYSAGTLAEEFLHEYGQLKTKDGGAVRSRVIKERPEAVAKEAAKGGAATKKAGPSSLDELIAEARRKARLVPGTTPADALKKVVEEVQKDPSIPEGDKKVIAEALGPGAR